MQKRFTMYCARPISGCSYDEVVEYYRAIIARFKDNFHVLTPMCGKGYLRNEIELKAAGLGQPISTNHAIKERDRWMVQSSDIVFVNLTNTSIVSIGSVMELAWADMLGKHSVVALEEENIHRHAFVLDCADIVFPTSEEAFSYLDKIASGSLD